jgi:hypothetical protein
MVSYMGIAAAALAAATMVHAPADRPAAAAPAGSTAPSQPAGRTGRFTLMALGDNRAADVEKLTHRYDLMIASDSVRKDALDAFRRRNPGAAVFCYVNTSDANGDLDKQPWGKQLWDDVNPHEDWFHHDADGQRVKIYFPKYPNRCAFNTGSVELQRYLAALVVKALKTGLYDGIQLDNVSTEFPFDRKLIGKWISAVPVKLTPQQWTADEVAMLKTVMKAASEAGFKDKTIIFNHMRSGEPEESRAYIDVVNGANCESWMSLRTEPQGRWGWKAKVEQVRSANHAGKLTNLLCTPAAPDQDEAMFCFGSYLMALEGDRAYFFYAGGYKIKQAQWYPFYDADLGAPRGEVEARDGGFLRAFTRGAVAVNPTTKPVTISLPARYVAPGGQKIDKITLEPKRAALLMAE